MSFYDEIKNYSIDDLELIIRTQQDLYTQDEMSQIKSLYQKKLDNARQKEIRAKELEQKLLEKRHAEEKARRATLPLACPKCGGPNERTNEICTFCGAKLDHSLVYDDYCEESKNNGSSQSFFFHYLISFIIPLIGFITGGIMLTNDDPQKSSAGKTCIILSIISVAICFFISFISSIFFYEYYMSLFNFGELY